MVLRNRRGNPSPTLRGAMRVEERRRVLRGVAVVAAVAVLLGLLGLVVGPVTWLVAGGTVRRLSGKEQADALNAVRQTLLAALAGAAGLAGLAFTARTYYLSRRGQVTDRFGKAVGYLASPALEERLGGIYALEHVMAESPRDHATVIEVLCAFVRARAPIEPGSPVGGEPSADIDAVLTVLARRPRRPEPNRPDLRATSLAKLSLRMHDFSAPPSLRRVFLTGADLREADLRGLDLSLAILSGADLRGALLHGTVLAGALLAAADLTDAVGLTAAQVGEAELDDRTRLPAQIAAVTALPGAASPAP
ncbi:MAG: pentapeptide repeat-containing protein [Catenulispora sp.]|nr:pentapeptide repeat-containing protein [Catenulispora sp.]